MEKASETRLIFVSFLLNFSKLNNILPIIFLSLSGINCLNPTIPTLSNNNRSYFGWISRKLYQCVPGFSVGVENREWIFCSFFLDYVVKVYIFCYWIWWVNTHKVSFIKSSFVLSLKNFSISMLVIPFLLANTCCRIL